MEKLRDVPGPIGPSGTNPDSVNDPRFPKVVDRTRDVVSDPIHRAMEEMAMIDSRRQLAGR